MGIKFTIADLLRSTTLFALGFGMILLLVRERDPIGVVYIVLIPPVTGAAIGALFGQARLGWSCGAVVLIVLILFAVLYFGSFDSSGRRLTFS